MLWGGGLFSDLFYGLEQKVAALALVKLALILKGLFYNILQLLMILFADKCRVRIGCFILLLSIKRHQEMYRDLFASQTTFLSSIKMS